MSKAKSSNTGRCIKCNHADSHNRVVIHGNWTIAGYCSRRYGGDENFCQCLRKLAKVNGGSTGTITIRREDVRNLAGKVILLVSPNATPSLALGAVQDSVEKAILAAAIQCSVECPQNGPHEDACPVLVAINPPQDECLDCGVCSSCIARSIAYDEEIVSASCYDCDRSYGAEHALDLWWHDDHFGENCEGDTHSEQCVDAAFIAGWHARIVSPDLNALATAIRDCTVCREVSELWQGPGMCERHASETATLLQRHLARVQ